MKKRNTNKRPQKKQPVTSPVIFNKSIQQIRPNITERVYDIYGFEVIREGVCQSWQKELWNMLNTNPRFDYGGNKYSRRSMNFGYYYDKNMKQLMKIGHIPSEFSSLIETVNYYVNHVSFFKQAKYWHANQVTIEEYCPGQGDFAPYIDDTTCFDDTIAIVNLGYCNPVVFAKTKVTPSGTTIVDTDQPQLTYMPQPGNIAMLKRDARYNWRRGVVRRKLTEKVQPYIQIIFRRVKT